MDKEQQAKLLSEIMQADEKDGLYEPTVSKIIRVQTAVEWLDERLQDKMYIQYGYHDGLRSIVIKLDEYMKLKQQAKQMEKEQIIKAWDDGDYAYFYSKKTGREFDNGEQYYNETYESNL